MPAVTLTEKKLKRISRVNDAVKEYFTRRPTLSSVPAIHLMPLFIRKGIFLKDTENGLPIRVLLRELHKSDLLYLLKDTLVTIEKRSYYFYRLHK